MDNPNRLPQEHPEVQRLLEQLQGQYDNIGRVSSVVGHLNVDYLLTELAKRGWTASLDTDGKTVLLSAAKRDTPFTPREGDVAIRLVRASHGLQVTYLLQFYLGSFWSPAAVTSPANARAVISEMGLVCVVLLDALDSIPGVYRREGEQ